MVFRGRGVSVEMMTASAQHAAGDALVAPLTGVSVVPVRARAVAGAARVALVRREETLACIRVRSLVHMRVSPVVSVRERVSGGVGRDRVPLRRPSRALTRQHVFMCRWHVV